VYARNLPTAYLVLNLSSNFNGFHVRSITGAQSTGPEWIIGSSTALSEHVVCEECAVGGGDNNPGQVSVEVLNGYNVSFNDTEWECGDAAAAYCLDIPSTATAAHVSINGGTVFGQCLGGTALAAVFHSNFASASLLVEGTVIAACGFANPSYVLKDDAIGDGVLLKVIVAVANMSNFSTSTSNVLDINSAYTTAGFTGISTANSIVINGNHNLTPGQTTFASLPAAASFPGAIFVITDSTSIAAEGQVCAGASTNKALAFSTGSGWKCF
jgi:hypothetical protein